MDEVQIYTGTLIGPHGEKIGRWVRFEDYSNATGGMRQTAPSAPACAVPGFQQHQGYGRQSGVAQEQKPQSQSDL